MRSSILLIYLTAFTVSAQPRGVHRPDSTAVKYGISVGGSANVCSSLTVGKRPASTNLHTIAGWENGNDTVKQMSIDSLTSPHNVTTNRMGYSTGPSTWGTTLLRYSDDGYDAEIKFVNNDIGSTGYGRGLKLTIPDSVSMLIGSSNGATLELFGRNSCCSGTFNLTASGSGYSYIRAQNLNQYIDTNFSLQARRTYLQSEYGNILYLDGTSTTGAITAYKKLRINSFPTVTSAVSVYAPSGDTIGLIRADSLTVKRAATAAVSDSTAKVPALGIANMILPYVNSAGALAATTSRYDPVLGNYAYGTNPVSTVKIYNYWNPINSAAIGYYSNMGPGVTTNGTYGAVSMIFFCSPSIAGGVTDAGDYRGVYTYMTLETPGTIGGGLTGNRILFGTNTGAGTIGTFCRGIDLVPYAGAGTITNFAALKIRALVAYGATFSGTPYVIDSDLPFASRLNGSVVLDDDTTGVVFGETQQARIGHNGTNMVYNNTVGNHVFSGTRVEVSRLLQDSIWHAYGGFQDSAVVVDIVSSNTWYHVTNASGTLWTGLEGDGITMSGDTMIIANAGDYPGSVSITANGVTSIDYHFRIFNVTQNEQSGFLTGATTEGTGNYTNVSFNVYLEAAAGDRFVMQVENTSGAQDITFEHANFYISMLHR